MNYLDKGKVECYWANSSSNHLPGKLIREGSPEIKMTMESLLKGESFCTMLDEQVVFDQLDAEAGHSGKDAAIWSLLLASGYLKVEYTLRQIEEKVYQENLVAKGIPRERIRKYGFAFCGKKVLIGGIV